MPATILSYKRWIILKYKSLLKAALVNLPFRPRSQKSHGTGGTLNARYCYAVWLRHLVIAHQNGLKNIPRVVAELGPGDSLGIGLAALISGTQKYYALDVVHHADQARNLAVFDELVALFRRRAPIPDRQEFPRVKPFLNDYSFPKDILTDACLAAALNGERLALIRQALADGGNTNTGEISVRYFVPWNDKEIIQPGVVDMIYSQAVLEYVEDLPAVYAALHRWLKPGGFMSHQIDFKSHDITPPWNGHWAFSEGEWKILKGSRPYFLNRELFSAHVNTLEKTGFNLVHVQKLMNASEFESPLELPKNFLIERFRQHSDDDLAVSGALMQSQKGLGS